MTRLWVAVVAAMVLVGLAAPDAEARVRGQGTLLIMQRTDCGQHGESSSVYFPFSGLFTGFEPNTTGTVTAYTQPGGVQVGQRSVTVDAQGNRCELVTGTAEPGQYKIVYDFGSGTGKQKVIRIVEAPPPSPTESPTLPESPGATESPTAPESPSATESPSSPPSSTSAPPSTASLTPTGTAAPGPSTSSSLSAAATPSTSVAAEKIIFEPLADPVGDAAVLARTGTDVTMMLGLAAVLFASGTALVVVGRRRGRHT
jgi:hypothetical protein